MDDADLFGDLIPTYKHSDIEIDEFDAEESPLIVNKPSKEVPPADTFDKRNIGAHAMKRGVTVPWLAQAFNLRRGTVTTKLAGAPVLRTGPRGAPVYDFAEVARYLVPPREDEIIEYIKNLDPKDMPEKIRRAYWSARREEQKAREEAGDLWRSNDVLNLFAELFTMIKASTTLWSNRIAKESALSMDARKLIDAEAKSLMNDIADMVVKLQEGQLTPSQLSDFDDEGE